MKEMLVDNKYVILRFDPGEEVLSGLITYAKAHTISAAHFTAIGAAKEITLAYYDLKTKLYEDHTITEDVEIASVIGNIGVLENTPAVHTHGVFAKRDLTSLAGHIKKIIVSATCEVTITKLNGTLSRHYDETTGLNLLS